MLLSAERKDYVWRPYELQAAEKHFGKVVGAPQEQVSSKSDGVEYVRWFPESEDITRKTYLQIFDEYEKLYVLKHINSFENFMYVHDKIACLDKWKAEGINNTPISFRFANEADLGYKLNLCRLTYPFLIRLNNSVSARHSWLITNYSDLKKYLPMLEKALIERAPHGINTSMMCSEFIDTVDTLYPHNVAYRVIVAGDKVVSGYVGVSPVSHSWMGVHEYFEEDSKDAWYYHTTKLCKIMKEREEEIVRAVHVLGLNHQGVDIIPERDKDNLYFLEVQTTYNAGFASKDNKEAVGNYRLPYFHPQNPNMLKFIKENMSELEQTIPMYIYDWLDKERHFDICYRNIKSYLEEK